MNGPPIRTAARAGRRPTAAVVADQRLRPPRSRSGARSARSSSALHTRRTRTGTARARRRPDRRAPRADPTTGVTTSRRAPVFGRRAPAAEDVLGQFSEAARRAGYVLL